MARAVVLDIEGTTSSLDSVRSGIVPYARARIPVWLVRADPETVAVIAATRALAERPDATLQEVTDILIDWSDRDVKATPLKQLQGMIWAEGFEHGELLSHIYPDVPPALRRWHGWGLQVAIYSSGSAQAQRTWFGHTKFGDLTGYLTPDGYFDTARPGPKNQQRSYAAVARALGLPPGQVLFLSDARSELDAARSAGLRTVGIRRPEDGSPDVGDHQAFADLDSVPLFDGADLVPGA
jgi:enolase-phosphatase E1